jgi:hypothetical protein
MMNSTPYVENAFTFTGMKRDKKRKRLKSTEWRHQRLLIRVHCTLLLISSFLYHGLQMYVQQQAGAVRVLKLYTDV